MQIEKKKKKKKIKKTFKAICVGVTLSANA